MIVNSTSGAVVWQDDIGRAVTFSGEWTLEPKFYLPLQSNMYWDGHDKTKLTRKELVSVLGELLLEAVEKEWTIVIEPGAISA